MRKPLFECPTFGFFLYTLKIFIPVPKFPPIFCQTIFLSTIFETFKICPFFDFKGNSFVLYSKICDPRFCFVPPDFFSIFFQKTGIFSDFFGTPRFFFSFFFSKNLISLIFLVPQDLFSKNWNLLNGCGIV